MTIETCKTLCQRKLAYNRPESNFAFIGYCEHCSLTNNLSKWDNVVIVHFANQMIASSVTSKHSFSAHCTKVCSVKKETKLNKFFCLIKSSKIIFIFLPEFYLIIWLMTSPKNFEKIPILKTWQQIFFWGIKTYFGKMMLFQAWKNRYFNQNMS